MINTIILDIGNVLAHFGWMEYLSKKGYSEDICLRIGRATVQSKLWKEWDRGTKDETELVELFCRQDPVLEKEIRDFFENLNIMIEEYDYTNGFVKMFKENGYKVYLLSNFGRKHYEDSSKKFSFIPYIDGSIISYTIRHIKPEPEIYHALIDQYHINPENAVFIDDVAENLEGAEAFGLHTLLFKSYGQILEELSRLNIKI